MLPPFLLNVQPHHAVCIAVLGKHACRRCLAHTARRVGVLCQSVVEFIAQFGRTLRTRDMLVCCTLLSLQVMDMCASPGSKTAQLLEALHQGDGLVRLLNQVAEYLSLVSYSVVRCLLASPVCCNVPGNCASDMHAAHWVRCCERRGPQASVHARGAVSTGVQLQPHWYVLCAATFTFTLVLCSLVRRQCRLSHILYVTVAFFRVDPKTCALCCCSDVSRGADLPHVQATGNGRRSPGARSVRCAQHTCGAQGIRVL